MNNMKQIAVLGLGRFGESVARSLESLGVEVMGVDINQEKVAEIAPFITHAVQGDLLDSDALESLGLRNFDVVILSIKNVEISCLATIAIKDSGAHYIVAQASGDAHGKILERIGVDKVIMPEKDMGTRIARSLAGNNIIDYMELSSKHSLIEITTPDDWVGHTLKENNIRNKYGVNVVAIRSGKSIQVSPKSDAIIHDGDILVVIGENNDLEKIGKHSSNSGKK
ncbi:MAG: TrkA family potassium uptake protein [Oscillospiraceae bacterium]|nr:TrkA family potassium uptake protein [Oscillospiraceae bacterium]